MNDGPSGVTGPTRIRASLLLHAVSHRFRGRLPPQALCLSPERHNRGVRSACITDDRNPAVAFVNEARILLWSLRIYVSSWALALNRAWVTWNLRKPLR